MLLDEDDESVAVISELHDGSFESQQLLRGELLGYSCQMPMDHHLAVVEVE